jgi:hypothetical protein
MAGDLKVDQLRHANRLREQLQRYYPQMLRFDSDLVEEWVLTVFSTSPALCSKTACCSTPPSKAKNALDKPWEVLLGRSRFPA